MTHFLKKIYYKGEVTDDSGEESFALPFFNVYVWQCFLFRSV